MFISHYKDMLLIRNKAKNDDFVCSSLDNLYKLYLEIKKQVERLPVCIDDLDHFLLKKMRLEKKCLKEFREGLKACGMTFDSEDELLSDSEDDSQKERSGNKLK